MSGSLNKAASFEGRKSPFVYDYVIGPRWPEIRDNGCKTFTLEYTFETAKASLPRNVQRTCLF